MDDLLKRIHIDPKIMVGKPVHIMNELACGMSAAEIVEQYRPRLTEDDVRAACAYASALLSGRQTFSFAAE